jgi:hypothetical protein
MSQDEQLCQNAVLPGLPMSPALLQRVISDVDKRTTTLAVFMFIAALPVLRDGGCLILVLTPLRG